MSSLSIIEWNAKHPSHWEWENLVGSSSTATENNKSWQPAEWGIEAEEGVDSGSLYSYGGGSASGGSSGGASIDPVHACMSKGSKSASLNSSSTEEMKLPKFSVEASKGYAENFSCKRDVTTAKLCGASPALETSLCSGEPFLSLNIGKRTYLEDVSDGRNSKASNFPSFVKSPDASVKRIKSNIQSMPAPSCQVEGCNIDLSSAKDYHRKHKVCASHSKSPKVVVNGVERRFCQQCSRFHGLSEFDENKRSCRKRLSDHNARRRKPHPDVSHFNQARLSTIIYGGLQEMNSMYSGVPRGNTKSSVNLTWSNTSALKFMQTKGDAPYRGKDGSVCADPHVFHGNKLPNNMRPVTAMSDGSFEQITVKDTTVKIFGGGSEGSLISAGSLDAPRNLHRALSLLSTDSHDSYKQSTVVLHDMNNTSIPRPWNYVVPQTLSLPSLTEYWNMEQCPSNSQRHDLTPQSGISGTVLGGSNLPECLVPSEGQNEYGFEPVHLA